MPPFAQLRLWLREGPRPERIAAMIAVAIAVVLGGLALEPVANGSTSPQATGAVAGTDGGSQPTGTSGATASAAAPGAPTSTGSANGPTGAAPTAVAAPLPGQPVGPAPVGSVPVGPATSGPQPTTPGSARATAGHGSSSSTPAGCGQLVASANGITATTVLLDVAIVQLAGAVGDAAFDIRPDQDKIFAAVTDYVNKNGGVMCGRKLVIKEYTVNPTDANDQQTKCLQMVADKPLAVINDAGYITPASFQCFIDAHLPVNAGISLAKAQAEKAAPYLFGAIPYSEQQVRNAVLGFAARGVFKGPKFTKIGLYEDSCDPAVNTEIAQDLAASGVTANQISTYVLSCDLVASPAAIQQAVIQQRGTSHVLLASSILNNENYARLASQQGLHPQYLVSDYGSSIAPAGSENWDAGFAGALGITSSHTGELSSGIANPYVTRCSKILTDHGLSPIASEQKDVTAVGICDQIFFMKQMLDHAGANPSQLAAAQAVSTMGKQLSGYLPDTTWNRAGRIAGGDYQREVDYEGACKCFKVVDQSFGPGY